MKNLILILCSITVILIGGCSKTPSQPIPCLRYTDLNETHFRYEVGVLSKKKFIAITSSEIAYESLSLTRKEIQAVSGLPVIQVAYWIGSRKPAGFQVSEEQYLIQNVPHVILSVTP